MVLEFVPLALVVLAWSVVAFAPVSRRADRVVTRLALLLFGSYTRQRESANTRQARVLRAAHEPTTFRVYASKTFLYAGLSALTGSILGAYLVVGVYEFLRVADDAVLKQLPPKLAQIVAMGPPDLSLFQLFGVFLASNATLGVAFALAAYQFRWSLPSYRADERARRIDVSLERNVSFMYALARSGMAFPEILRILTRNRDVYGETADEIAVAVKEVDLFGTDILRAMSRLARRTPNEDLEEFSQNLASVLRSGRNLPGFLRDRYEYFKEESEAKQEQFLELLATLAEAYVTIFVAGPLFLITILVVMGLVLGGTLLFLRLIGYVVLPLATFGFVVYLDSITDPTEAAEREDRNLGEPDRFGDVRTSEESLAGDEERRRANEYRWSRYRDLRPVYDAVRRPVDRVVQEPVLLFAVTVPLATAYLATSWWPYLARGVLEPALYDDALVQATLFVLGTFAIVHEVGRRRVKAIEESVPDFLDRLAATNEAGMSIVASFERVVKSDLGALTPELERTWADVRWGAHVEVALHRFRDRLETPAVTRVVALTTNAMSASGDIGPVLRIAADEAKSSRRLERDRRNEMLTYLVVIYLSFFVFLTIIVALDVIFIPKIPTGLGGAAGTNTPGVPGLGGGGGVQAPEKEAYSLVFFHTSLVQAVCSGLVAGQMGENDVRAGAKHATIMLGFAYGVFVLFA